MRKEQEVFQTYEDINVMELFKIIWVGKLRIIGLTTIAAILSIVYSLSLPDIYRSEVLLAPASSTSGGLNGLAQYGGLASLAGIRVGSSGVDKVTLGLATLKSRAFIKDFIVRRDILVHLMALKSWSYEVTEIDTAVYDIEKNAWQVEKPGLQAAYSKFVSIFSFSKDKTSGLLTIAISNKSPILAQEWVTWLVQDLNQSMKESDIKESEHAITLLEAQLQSTGLVEMRSVFFRIIEEQVEKIMIANVRPDYLFKVIDPAIIPETKSSPNRALICILGTLFGGFLSVFLVFLMHFLQPKKDH